MKCKMRKVPGYVSAAKGRQLWMCERPDCRRHAFAASDKKLGQIECLSKGGLGETAHGVFSAVLDKLGIERFKGCMKCVQRRSRWNRFQTPFWGLVVWLRGAARAMPWDDPMYRHAVTKSEPLGSNALN
jgi:hypothetical protein